MSNFEKFVSIFAGRMDVHAERRPRADGSNKYTYWTVEAPLTATLLKQHFQGDLCLGLYPIVENRVKWFAIDFDAPKDENNQPVQDAFGATFAKVKEQYHALTDAGITCYIERSRSGTGCHIWVFFEEWVPATLVRQALLPLVIAPRSQDGVDLVYPMQDMVPDGKLGSLLMLPYYGKAALQGNATFIDAYDQTAISLKEFVLNVRFNKSAVLRKLVETHEKTGAATRLAARAAKSSGTSAEGRETLSGALKVISPYGCQFMRHCWETRKNLPEPMWEVAISQCTMFEHGREFAHAISRDYAGYSEAEVDERYNRKLENPVYSCQYIKNNWPQLACNGCTCKAPYEVASKTLVELVEEGTSLMELLGDFQDDIKLVEALNNGGSRSGISWGIPGMDTITRLRPSELVVVGGLPSIGKTWFMVETAIQIAKQGALSFLYSGEPARQPLRQRFLARQAQLDLERLRGEHPMKLTSTELAKLREAGSQLKQLPIYTDFSTLSPAGMLAQTERTLLTNKIPLTQPYALIYDYLQFTSGNEDQDRVTQIGTMIREYKYLAKVLERPVIVFSQLRRVKEEKVDQRPNMADFADSSAIERNMDTGIVLYGERAEGPFAGRWLDIVKQREGRGNVRLHYLLHQAYGKWEFSEARETPALTSLAEEP